MEPFTCSGVHSLCSSEPRKYFKISSQSGGLSYLPKFGLSFPERIFKAVLFPIPLVPTRPSTCPGRGIGSLCSLKLLAEYRCVTWVSRFVGRLMMCIAPKGHFLGQIPQPIHSRSEMYAIFESGVTSIQSLPVRTTGQDFLHSCRHFCSGQSLVPVTVRSTHFRLALYREKTSSASVLGLRAVTCLPCRY